MRNTFKALTICGAVSILSGPSVFAAQQPRDVTLEGVRLDHVIVSLPSPLFDDLSQFLGADFGTGWMPVPTQDKGFILSGEAGPYVELLNTSRTSMPLFNYPVGYQIAITSTNTEDAKRRAVEYFGHAGRTYGRSGLFTVGVNYAYGDPLGGTFFVSYGEIRPPMGVDGSPVASLVAVVSTMAEFRMDESQTYEAFGFSARPVPGGVEVKDSAGVRVCMLEMSNDDFFSLGHVALQFRLMEPVSERREVLIGDSGVMKAVFDSGYLWLLLRTDLFDPYASGASTC